MKNSSYYGHIHTQKRSAFFHIVLPPGLSFRISIFVETLLQIVYLFYKKFIIPFHSHVQVATFIVSELNLECSIGSNFPGSIPVSKVLISITNQNRISNHCTILSFNIYPVRQYQIFYSEVNVVMLPSGSITENCRMPQGAFQIGSRISTP